MKGYNHLVDFVIKVILSFIVGGTYVSGVIWLSEKLGSRIGGAIAGLPSTILISMIFINITEGPPDAREAVSIVPLMFVATLIYAYVFIEIETKTKKQFFAIGCAIISWLLVVLLLKLVVGIPFAIIVALGISSLIIANLIFNQFDTKPPKKIQLPKHIYIMRFFNGGTVIAGAVIVARLLGPVWGGIVGSMPAMLGCILYFLSKSQGGEFLRGFLRRLPLSYISSLLFLVVVHQSLTNLNSILSFILGMATSLLYTSLLIGIKSKTEK